MPVNNFNLEPELTWNLKGMEPFRMLDSPVPMRSHSSSNSSQPLSSHSADKVTDDNESLIHYFMSQNYRHNQNLSLQTFPPHDAHTDVLLDRSQLSSRTPSPSVYNETEFLLQIQLNSFHQICIDLRFFKLCLDQVYFKLIEQPTGSKNMEWYLLTQNLIEKVKTLSNQCNSYLAQCTENSELADNTQNFLDYLKKVVGILKREENSYNNKTAITLIEEIRSKVSDFKNCLIEINNEIDDYLQ